MTFGSYMEILTFDRMRHISLIEKGRKKIGTDASRFPISWQENKGVHSEWFDSTIAIEAYNVPGTVLLHRIYRCPKKTHTKRIFGSAFGAYSLENGFSMKYKARPAVLKLLLASESPAGLLKRRLLGPNPRVSD